jgi:hypothetical protein
MKLDAGFHLALALAAFVGIAPVRAELPSRVSGDLSVGGDLNLQDFSIRRGAVLEVPRQLRFQRGGTGTPLPPSGGRVRAQPGGNFEIQPLGDYYRGALDIYPTQGKKPDMDALAELTIHRIHPSNEGHEMLSISGLADSQRRFGVIVEAHGKGRIKPLDFQMIQGGLLAVDKNIEPYDAIAMRMKTDGTMQFSAVRNGGEPGPVDAICIERDHPGNAGSYPSDSIRMTAKRMNVQGTTSDWRTNVQLPAPSGSALSIENREGGQAYAKKLQVTSSGDVELPTPGAGVILTSPNGKKWRLGVTDGGDLKVDPLSE